MKIKIFTIAVLLMAFAAMAGPYGGGTGVSQQVADYITNYITNNVTTNITNITTQIDSILAGELPPNAIGDKVLIVGEDATLQYNTVNAAFDSAEAGDLILVLPGMYTGHIDADVPNVTVASLGGQEVTHLSLVMATNAGLIISADSVLFDGFTMTGDAAGSLVQISSDPTTVTVQGCVLNSIGAPTFGATISVDGSDKTSFLNCTFRTNSGDGAFYGNKSIADLVFDHCTFIGQDAASGYAWQISGVNNATISNCVIKPDVGYAGSFASGIFPHTATTGPHASDSIFVHNNFIRGCSKAIRIGHSTQTEDLTAVFVTDNTIVGNYYGVNVANDAQVYPATYQINGNIFYDNTQDIYNENATALPPGSNFFDDHFKADSVETRVIRADLVLSPTITALQDTDGVHLDTLREHDSRLESLEAGGGVAGDSISIFSDSLKIQDVRLDTLEAPEQDASKYWVTDEIAGETLVAPCVGFVDSLDGKVYKFDSDSTRHGSFAPVLVMTGGIAEDTIVVSRSGFITGLTGLAKGSKVWAGTAGGYTCNPDTTGIMQGIGDAISTTEMWFSPDKVWAERDTVISSSIAALEDSIDVHDILIKLGQDTAAVHNTKLQALNNSLITGYVSADSIYARTAVLDSLRINYVLHIINTTVSDMAIAIVSGKDTTFVNPAANSAFRHSNAGTTVFNVDTVGNMDVVAVTSTTNAIGTAQTIGLTLQNTTAAAAGSQQNSPGLIQTGYGHATTPVNSQRVDFMWQVVPVEGTTAPTGQYNLYSRIASGSWSATPIISISNLGVTTLSSGAISAPAHHSSTRLRLERSAGVSLDLMSSNTNTSRVYFSDTDVMGIGSIGYNHADNSMIFLTGGNSTGIWFDNSRNAVFGASSRYGSTARILAWGGNIVSWNAATLGSATLTNPDLTSGTSWTGTNDATLTGDECQWVFSAGTASTLTQTSATFLIPVQPNRFYAFTYVVSDVAGTPSASITTAIASATTALTLTNGAQATYFISGASPGNFVITATLTTGQRFDLDTFSLKEVQGGNVIAGGKFMGGGTLGMSVSGSGNAKFDANVEFEGTTVDAIKTSLVPVDPTSTSKTISVPNASGTMAVSATAPVTLSAAGDIGLNALKSTQVDTVGTDGLATQEDIGLLAPYAVYKTIYVDAGAMVPSTTNGAVSGTNEYGTNDIDWDYMAFDGGATEERVQFKLAMPEDWNLGTVKVKFYWSSATGSTTGDKVSWAIKAGALSSDDAIDAALGTAQAVEGTLLADNGTDLQATAATPALTVGGTPALGDLTTFEVFRDTDGSVATTTDDMTEDAWLLGVRIQYLTNSTAVSGW